ncbi:hypothetical protein [Kordia jejudonensis]|uniref:hypothetical protein n=1 Tax=Kordia jejudonensis TaxID=1348245 RepID=UPI000629A60E|nr:hypothetical protein [Kordia jejudonensis]
MKKQNLTSLTLNKKSISNLQIGEVKGGLKTWVNTECRTETCPPSERCEPVTIRPTCNYNSCVVCDM